MKKSTIQASSQSSLPVPTIPHTPISEAQYEAVCEAIERDCLSLKKACRKVGVSDVSALIYLRVVGEIAERRYARARALRAENRVDDLAEVEQNMLNDISTCKDPKIANAKVQAWKIIHDRVKWQASKEANGKYGDKLDITTGDKPLPSIVTIVGTGSAGNPPTPKALSPVNKIVREDNAISR